MSSLKLHSNGVDVTPNIIMQVFQPWIQSRKLAYTNYKHVKYGILKSAVGRLSTDQGTPDTEFIKKFVFVLFAISSSL